MSTLKTVSRPQIHMIEEEAERLSDLAIGIEGRFPRVSKFPIRETSREKLHSHATIPGDVVTMGSFVELGDESTGANRTAQLVYPPEADISLGRVQS